MASLLSSLLAPVFSSVLAWLSAVARSAHTRRRNEGYLIKNPKARAATARRVGETSHQGSPSPSPDRRSQGSHDDTGSGSLDEPPPPRFILDSVATSHVAGDMSLFSPPFRTDIIPEGIAAAGAYKARDGGRLPVTRAGTISWDNFHLPDVLCVPGLGAGVIRVSVQQLVARGYLVMFGGGQCSVMEQSSGELVGKGQLHYDDARYHLKFLNIPANTDDGTKTP